QRKESTMRPLARILGLVVLSGGACVGAVEDGSPSGSSAPVNSGGPEAKDWGGAAPSCRVSGDSGRGVVRRLDRTEYNNTVRDLLRDEGGRPADDFPTDSTGSHGQDSNGLTVSPLLFEKMEIAATRLAAAAVAKSFIRCDPTRMDKRVCAKQTLEPFMTRAWRRPVTPAEVDGVLAYLPIVEAQKDETDPF